MYGTAARSGSYLLIASQKWLQSSQNQLWGKALSQTLLKEKFLQVVIRPGDFELLQLHLLPQADQSNCTKTFNSQTGEKSSEKNKLHCI